MGYGMDGVFSLDIRRCDGGLAIIAYCVALTMLWWHVLSSE